jgi:hypothetical protein
MRLTIAQVFSAMQALDAIIREKRAMPQLGKYRLARMHAKLLPEFVAANARRDGLITKYGRPRDDGQFAVPPDRMAELNAEWEPIAEAYVGVDVEPIRLADLGDQVNGALEAIELLLLGDLVTE